jgi:hypothetical protein
MADSPKLWQVPDSPDYGKNGRRFEHSFWVLDEVATVLGLATETMATGCLLEAAAFFLGAGSVAVGGMFGVFWAIGSGYAEASADIAKEWVTTGYARGVVLAAHGRKASVMQRMFGGRVTWNAVNSSDDAVARKAHLNGLVAGYLDCFQLRPQQKKNLWTNLETRNGDRWGREEYANEHAAALFYSGLSGTFRQYHLKEE